jgi:hypothetical protein
MRIIVGIGSLLLAIAFAPAAGVVLWCSRLNCSLFIALP